jgi:hypothetical protein
MCAAACLAFSPESANGEVEGVPRVQDCAATIKTEWIQVVHRFDTPQIFLLIWLIVNEMQSI